MNQPFFFCLLLIFSCTSRKVAPACWDESLAQVLLTRMQNMISTMSNNKSAEAKLLSSSCTKRKYQVGDRLVIIFNSPDKSVHGMTWNLSTDPKKCLDQALLDIAAFHSSSYEEIIRLHREKHPNLWADIDLSPVGWLHCDEKGIDYRESLATFLHEMTHQNGEKLNGCLYDGVQNKNLCFDFPSSLPMRSLAKRETFPTKDPQVLKAMAMIQKLYLTDSDFSLIFLLDELGAYTVTNKFFTEQIRLFGEDSFFAKDGKRPGIVLPLIYNYSLLYLTRLKIEKPDLYQEVFVKNQKNRLNLLDLLKNSKTVYQGWRKQLKHLKRPEKEIETNLWKDSQKLEAELKL